MTWAAWVAAITGQTQTTQPATTTATTEPPVTTPPAREGEPVLEGLADPNYTPPPWPKGLDEASFRSHLDELHRKYDSGIGPPKRDRLRTWRDRYTREALAADNYAERLNHLAKLAAACPRNHDDDRVRDLIVEAKRGVPRYDTSEVSQLDDPKHEPNPQSLGPTSVMGWFLPRTDEPDPPRCA